MPDGAAAAIHAILPGMATDLAYAVIVGPARSIIALPTRVTIASVIGLPPSSPLFGSRSLTEVSS
jgi:hypothetical protein